jgi:hypothetical protein
LKIYIIYIDDVCRDRDDVNRGLGRNKLKKTHTMNERKKQIRKKDDERGRLEGLLDGMEGEGR